MKPRPWMTCALEWALNAVVSTLHLGNKHALFMQSLDRYMNVMFRSSDLVTNPGPPLQVIAEMFAVGVEQSVNDSQHRGCFLTNTITELSATNPEVAQFIKSQTEVIEQHFYRPVGTS